MASDDISSENFDKIRSDTLLVYETFAKPEELDYSMTFFLPKLPLSQQVAYIARMADATVDEVIDIFVLSDFEMRKALMDNMMERIKNRVRKHEEERLLIMYEYKQRIQDELVKETDPTRISELENRLKVLDGIAIK